MGLVVLRFISGTTGVQRMNAAGLLWGVLFGSIGLGYFLYGRKQKSAMPFVCGLLLMGYTYVFDSPFAIVAVGVVLMAVPYFVRI